MVKTLGLISANYADTLGSITEQRSLASLPFGGRYRLIDFALSNMTNSGINTVCLITPYIYRSIMDHVGSGKEWALDRKVGGLLILPGAVFGMKSSEGKFLIRDFLQNRVSLERSNADVVLMMTAGKVFNYNFAPILEEHHQSGRDVTLFYTSTPNSEERSGEFLTINKDEKVKNIRERSSGKDNLFMDAMLINRTLLLKMLDWYKGAPHLDIMDTIKDNLSKMDIATHEIEGYVGHIDSLSDFMSCNRDLLDRKIHQELFYGENKIYTKITDSPPTRYGNDAEVINSIIPAGCDIKGKVEDSILFRGVKVAEGSTVNNSIVLQRSTIEPNVVIKDVICDKTVTISRGTRLFGAPSRPCIIGKSEMY